MLKTPMPPCHECVFFRRNGQGECTRYGREPAQKVRADPKKCGPKGKLFLMRGLRFIDIEDEEIF